MIKMLISFIKGIIESKSLLFQLTKKDFKSRYLGSMFGLVWAFVQPMVTICVFWFVFEMGFRARPVKGDIPFILWLSTGIIPWFFFSEVLASATNSIVEHSYLVKKIVFRVSLLPIIKILSATIVHTFFIFLIVVMMALYGYYPTWYNLQVIYYFFCSVVLLLGISWITSSVVIFFKDMSQIIQVVIQFGFWGTPIFWTVTNLSEKWQMLFKLNPVYYITEGFRYSFIDQIWFWEKWKWGLYFWCVTIIIFVLGAIIFRKLKPHFADVI